jgi:hypothetical protein
VTDDVGGSLSERRQHRLRAYIKGRAPRSSAGITMGPDLAGTLAGQAGVLTAVNLLARAHHSVVLAVPDVPLLAPSPLGGTDLRDACCRIVTGVDPSNSVEVVRSIPDGVASMGIGAACGDATVYCGGRRWTVIVSRRPVETTSDPSSAVGMGLAVAEGAALLFRMALGAPVRRDTRLSLWTLDSVDSDKATGPADAGPVDVGRTWLVGAGAVGSCLAWWLSVLGALGEWTVIDADVVKDINLDRSLAFFAHHTGELGGDAASKAVVASALIPGARPVSGWWSSWVATDPPSPDVLVLAANDHGVRPSVATYSHPAVIAATTSRNWTAELHRHLVLRDGCVSCRFPEAPPLFECATGLVDDPAGAGEACEEEGAGSPKDASLPFLSATAGLLAATGLLHVQYGQWATHEHNQWAFGFDATAPALVSRAWPHWASCAMVANLTARKVVHGTTRWAGLDVELGQ